MAGMKDIMDEMLVKRNAGAGPKLYVLGFLFNQFDSVALIRKRRPAWQAGKLNGIGGKVEIGETPVDAMRREFAEESGLVVNDWRCFAVLDHDGNGVFCFTARGRYPVLTSVTDEKVDWFHISNVGSHQTMRNLGWLIPLAMSESNEIAIVEDNTPIPEAA